MVLQRVSGVHSAEVSYEMGRAVVTFDADVTTPERFIEELERKTDFSATVVGANAVVASDPRSAPTRD